MLITPELFTRGYHLSYFPLPPEVETYVRSEDYVKLDHCFKSLCGKDGQLFKYLLRFHDFTSIEFIISIRDSNNDWEEDGIWHDDGSRVFAFSLSLSLEADKIKGGRLGIRVKGDEQYSQIPTPSYGGIILFLTGLYGFEHCIHQVLEGKRMIIAGWCS
jgi:hypothetical protein